MCCCLPSPPGGGQCPSSLCFFISLHSLFHFFGFPLGNYLLLLWRLMSFSSTPFDEALLIQISFSLSLILSARNLFLLFITPRMNEVGHWSWKMDFEMNFRGVHTWRNVPCPFPIPPTSMCASDNLFGFKRKIFTRYIYIQYIYVYRWNKATEMEQIWALRPGIYDWPMFIDVKRLGPIRFVVGRYRCPMRACKLYGPKRPVPVPDYTRSQLASHPVG